ncbi:MAG: hypothetical protein ACETVZ_00290 [Phycisphaerae bacterium]
MTDIIIHCERCEARCKIDSLRNPDAKILRHSKEPKGLCVNCAVHDWLRNTYPPNILLAQSGPKILLYPHIQKQFAEIMRSGFADAKPDEIDWERIIENWDLPFPNKIKRSCSNPCSQQELDEITAGKRPGLGQMVPSKPDPLGGKATITSFEELNELKPGLGDELKRCLLGLK